MGIENVTHVSRDEVIRQLRKFEDLEDDSQRSHYCYELLRQAGYSFEDIKTHEIKNNPDDVIYVYKKGHLEEERFGAAYRRIVVIGAHFDAKPNSLGILDNASGTVQVISLAKTFRDVPTKYSYVFALFGGEEDGLKGSESFLHNFPGQDHIKFMLNIDCVGRNTCYHGNKSDDKLEELLARAGKDVGHKIRNADMSDKFSSDYASFSRNNIPVLALGTSNLLEGVIHSPNDRLSAINVNEFYALHHVLVRFVQNVEAEHALDLIPKYLRY